jgi:hypothetical protein
MKGLMGEWTTEFYERGSQASGFWPTRFVGVTYWRSGHCLFLPFGRILTGHFDDRTLEPLVKNLLRTAARDPNL